MKNNICILFLMLFAFGGKSQSVLPNPGFEDWTQSGTYEDPDGWTTSNQFTSLLSIVSVSKSSDSYSGNYALMMETNFIPAPANQPVPGLVTTGNLQLTTQTIDGGVFYNGRPDSVVGWYKYEPANTDTGYITFLLFTIFRDTVGVAVYPATSSNDSYKRFSAPIEYRLSEAPYQAYFVLTSSGQIAPQEGSKLFVDDMELVFSTGVLEGGMEEIPMIYPTVSSGWFYFNNYGNEQKEVLFYDLDGKLIGQFNIEVGTTKLNVNLSQGMYLVQIGSARTNYKTIKVLVR